MTTGMVKRAAPILAVVAMVHGCGPATTSTSVAPAAAPEAAAEAAAAVEVQAAELQGSEEFRQKLFLGDQYRSSGLPLKAAEEYEKALGMEPENTEVYPRLGYALVEAEEFERAVKIYQRYVALAPKECDSHSSLGFAYLRQGLTDQAIASYERALELCPTDPNAYTNLGKVYREGGYPIEAIEAFRRSVELNPDDILGYESLAKLYSERKLYPEAVRMYEAVLIHPDHGKDERWVAWAHSRVASMYRWADAFDAAIPHYRSVLASTGSDEDLKTRAIRGLAVSYEKTQQMSLAIDLYEDLIVQVPEEATYYYRLGELLNDVGRHQEAIDQVKAGQKVDPACSPYSHCVVGEAYEKLGGLANFKRAERSFRKAVSCGGDAHYVEYARKQIDRQKQLIKIEELTKQKEQQGY